MQPIVRDADWYVARLKPAQSRPRVVIDTDAANEIDDQFALAWALLSPEIEVEAIYACPFSFAHRRGAVPAAPADARAFSAPAIGMERSYEEILRVCDLLGGGVHSRVFRGSAGYLQALDAPLHSAAVDHLIATARGMHGDEPLYVVAIGCATNVASALLLAPDIAHKIVVVWTSGYPSCSPQRNNSFNLEQDMLASTWLLDSGVPLVYLPGYQVGAQLRLSLPEMERFVKGRGPKGGAIGDYLYQLFTHNPLWEIVGFEGYVGYSWVMWDLINFAWLINPAWVPSEIVSTPLLLPDKRWQSDPARHPMREAYAVQRDAIFRDFFKKLELGHVQ